MLPPSALPAGETMQAQREPGQQGQSRGSLGQAPHSFPGGLGSAADPALFRGAAGRR